MPLHPDAELMVNGNRSKVKSGSHNLERQRKIRTVDLFCGCGGLALGFHLHEGKLAYETVLGVDIDSAALRIFNQNFGKNGGRLPIGRKCDLNWFNHRAEVQLYYLLHCALWGENEELVSRLQKIGTDNFLQEVRGIDDDFAEKCAALARSPDYSSDWDAVDRQITQLALFKTTVSGLGMKSLRNPSPDLQNLPWSQEYEALAIKPIRSCNGHIPEIHDAAVSTWNHQVEKFQRTAEGTARGHQKTVAERTVSLLTFLKSSSGHAIRDLWIDWRTARESAKARFFTKSENSLQKIYDDGWQVNLVLGGPPCKGWSRIGRAVIRNLRSQGTYSWACEKLGDERNALLYKYVLFLEALRPNAFLFENVAHFDSSLETPSGSVNAGSLLQEAIEEISDKNLRYEISSKIVKAREHAIPQDRERFILIGARSSKKATSALREIFASLPTFATEVPLKVALAGLPSPSVFDHASDTERPRHQSVIAAAPIDEGMPDSQKVYVSWTQRGRKKGNPALVDGNIVRKPRRDDGLLYEYLAPGKRWMDYKFSPSPTLRELKDLISRLRASKSLLKTIGEIANEKQLADLEAKLDDSFFVRLLLESLDPPEGPASPGHHLLADGYLSKGTDKHGDWLERLSPEKPCKTIVAHIGKDTYGYVHPYEPRALSLREAARVQTFPDSFRFQGVGLVDAYSMIGNAVPPLLAAHFAKALESIDDSSSLFATAQRGDSKISDAKGLNGCARIKSQVGL